MPGLVLVEGLPGSGKTTVGRDLANWLSDNGIPSAHWGEGRPDHPVDFEQVAVLTRPVLQRICDQFPQWERSLLAVATPEADHVIVRHGMIDGLPQQLSTQLDEFDSYDGHISPELHSRVLTASWSRYGTARPPDAVQIWDGVLLQNPVCSLLARHDQSAPVLNQHVRGLAEAVQTHRPVLVYLDPGDPEASLRRAAEERSTAWLDFVIEYHTAQGYGVRRGLHGFDGYVEFMKVRREMELDLIPTLPMPTLIVPVDPHTWPETTTRVTTFMTRHLADA